MATAIFIVSKAVSVANALGQISAVANPAGFLKMESVCLFVCSHVKKMLIVFRQTFAHVNWAMMK